MRPPCVPLRDPLGCVAWRASLAGDAAAVVVFATVSGVAGLLLLLVRVTLDVLPDVLLGYDRQRMTLRAGDLVVTDPTAALVSNNPYNVDDIAGLGQRPRLDGGVLGLIAVEVHNSRGAAALLRGPHPRGVTALTVSEVIVTTPQATISAGIDGESVLLDTPAQCRVRAAALRVRVPRQRPGAPPARQALTLGRLLRLAGPRHHETTGS